MNIPFLLAIAAAGLTGIQRWMDGDEPGSGNLLLGWLAGWALTLVLGMAMLTIGVSHLFSPMGIAVIVVCGILSGVAFPISRWRAKRSDSPNQWLTIFFTHTGTVILVGGVGLLAVVVVGLSGIH